MQIQMGIAGMLYGKRLPRWDGVLECAGTREEVHICRDRHGIPTICASNRLDAWYGLGFCQAQDRAFQLEVYKRQATGTLSALFGEQTLAADRLARTIGFLRTATGYLAHLDDEERSILDHFLAGLNYGLSSANAKKPHEFEILKSQPTAYEAVDVLSLLLLLSFSLTHWVQKITRLKLAMEGGQAAILGIDPGYAGWKYLTKPVGRQAGRNDQPLVDDLASALKYLNKEGYSNNWVISPQLAGNGRPILANDPHLGAEIPAPWYLAQLKWGDQLVAGACYPGTPFFLVGYNRLVSWGLTAAFLDNTDLFIERLSEDGKTYEYQGQHRPVKVLEETIEVRGSRPQKLSVRSTGHGPLLTGLAKEKLPPLSFKAAWAEPGTVNGFFKLPFTRTVKEIGRVFRDWPMMSLNLVCADDVGNTAWFLVGRAPRRKTGNGLLPVPGWTGRYEWKKGYAKLPSLINPAAGFIATANNKPVDDRRGKGIGFDYIDGYRHGRIVEMISSAQGKISLADCRRMQQDVHSTVWAEIREVILAIKPVSQLAKNGLDLLAAWDGKIEADSAAATYFEVLLAHILAFLTEHYAKDNDPWLANSLVEGMGGSGFGLRRVSRAVELIRSRSKEAFGPDPSDTLAGFLDQAWQALVTEQGNDLRAWQWGKVRKLTLNHPISPFLGQRTRIFNQQVFNAGPYSIGGDEQCVAVAAGDMLNPYISPNFIPNLRMVVETGQVSSNFFTLAGGISGNPFSRHYRDLLELWLVGGGISIDPEAGSPAHRLVLRPGQSRATLGDV